jgi:curli biogenesis system outer membrane secretion channel CsgG
MITKKMLSSLLMLTLGLTALAVGVYAQKKKADSKYKNKFECIEITRFDVKAGVELPKDWLITMTEELITQMKQTGKFKDICREGETPTDPNAPAMKLVGTVIEYKQGNRAARYLIGFGAGKTVVKAHIKLIDRATGEVLFEDDVDGKVVMGVIGGESVGATRGLAKEVASKTKKEFFSS